MINDLLLFKRLHTIASPSRSSATIYSPVHPGYFSPTLQSLFILNREKHFSMTKTNAKVYAINFLQVNDFYLLKIYNLY